MASLVGIWDETGWLADRIPLDCFATFSTTRESGVIHGLAFELPSLKAHISWMREVDGVEESCFHLVSLASELRFPFLEFILEILGEYGFPCGDQPFF